MEKYADFKDLSRKEKREFIWDYYKIHIIAGILGLLALGWFVNHYFINPPAEVALDITVFSDNYNSEKGTELEEQLNQAILDASKNETVMIDYINIGESVDPAMRQAAVVKMAAKASIGEFDLMLFQGDFYRNYDNEGVLQPLDQLLAEAGAMPPESDLVRGRQLGKTDDMIYLVKVSNNEYIKQLINPSIPLYIGVHADSSHQTEVVSGLRFLLAQ